MQVALDIDMVIRLFIVFRYLSKVSSRSKLQEFLEKEGMVKENLSGVDQTIVISK